MKPASDVVVNAYGRPIFSVMGIIIGSTGTMLSLYVNVLLSFKQSREGRPRHIWTLGLVSLRFRAFQTDEWLFGPQRKRNTAILVAAHTFLILVVVAAAVWATNWTKET